MNTIWVDPSNNLELSADAVHVWRVGLKLNDSHLNLLSRVLSEDEHTRAQQFRFEKDRILYVACRGLLRTLLASYKQTKPEKIRFFYHPKGKPALEQEAGKSELSFNVSRSGDLALIAITMDRRLGVDVEKMDRSVEVEKLAEQFLAANEAASLRSLPYAVQREAFFNCWTRKEAYLKALGSGLSLPLDQFEVSLLPGEPAVLKKSLENTGIEWFMKDVDPGRGYKGAVVAEGSHLYFSFWQWPEDRIEIL